MKLINLFDYEQAAQSKMRASFFGYYAGGAGDEITLRENRTVFDSIKLRPRVLIDVSHRTLETTILGHPTALPVVIAPMALAKLAHRKGEVAIATAAKKAGIIHCLSTLSSTSLETVASVGAANWFQLYIYKERGITTRLIERAAAAGYKALVLTVDTAVVGVRENLLRTGFRPPRGVKAENFTEFYGAKAALRLPAQFSPIDFDSSLTWDDLKWLIANSSLPVLVKGVLRGDDAKRAIDCGVAGIIVSNHGGRQLDTAVAGIKALPEVVAAVGAQTEVLVDGGIRRGTDIVKALALGARAVLVGRPVLWGLAVSAQKGVEQIFDVLKRELDIAMALCGCSSVGEIGPDLITE
ncbi:MAG: alpha-hydroxy-acid oxidizing protein [Anaerolineae bacterium]|nr:alpha-hydroxy-acid oxidizing protein [Anaerolineae bacterium]